MEHLTNSPYLDPSCWVCSQCDAPRRNEKIPDDAGNWNEITGWIVEAVYILQNHYNEEMVFRFEKKSYLKIFYVESISNLDVPDIEKIDILQADQDLDGDAGAWQEKDDAIRAFRISLNLDPFELSKYLIDIRNEVAIKLRYDSHKLWLHFAQTWN